MQKAIIDTQLPPKLARFLQKQGWDAVHTTDFEEGHLMADQTIREIAARQDRIVVTKDNDFFDLFLAKGLPPKVLLLGFGNIGNHDLLFQFDRHLDSISHLFENGAEFVVFGPDGIVEY